MGYIIGIIKKFLGAREVISVLLAGLQVAFYIALAFFLYQLLDLLMDLYQLIKQLFNMGSNDFKAKALKSMHRAANLFLG